MLVEGSERREIRPQVMRDELKNALGVGQVFELVVTQVVQLRVRRQLLAHQLCHGQREQDLAAMTGSQQPRNAAEWQAEIVVAPALDSPVCSAMRTRSGPVGPHAPVCRRRWAANAAFNAAGARAKAAQNPSPAVRNTMPSCSLIAWRRMLSCCASASGIASGCCSQSRVLPSISVYRNVTVPVGSTPAIGCGGSLSATDTPA